MSGPSLAAIAALVVVTCGLAAFLVLGSTASTQPVSASEAAGSARKQPITGKLNKPGYTVIALARNGRAKTVRARSGAFELRPPAKKVTLHLRASDGTYAGPVVVAGRWNLVKVAKNKLRRAERKLKKAKARLSKASGKKAIRKAKRKVSAARKKVKQARRELKTARRRAAGKEVVLGVSPGAELGAISVKAAAGYSKSKLKLRQWKRWVVEENRARAKKGVPIGAGNFGRVRSKNTGGGVPGDLDRDGVSDPLDIDDDGDLVLDEFDIDTNPLKQGTRAGAASEAQAAQAGGEFNMNSWTDMGGGINANAPGVDDADIDAALKAKGRLNLGPGFPPPAGSAGYTSGELDCGELSYCSAGGTGEKEIFQVGLPDPDLGPPTEPFPAPGETFGSFDKSSPGSPKGFLTLRLKPNATSDEIRAGDVLIARTKTSAGSQFEFATTLDDVFATTLALGSYTDELWTTHEVPYPSPGDLPVVDGPDADSDVEVTLNFWRPQRRSIPEEVPPGGARWIDIGGLEYFAGVVFGGGGGFCPQNSYSESDPNLSPGTATGPPGGGPVLADSVPDQPANPDNTFTYTINLSQCVASNGGSFDPGVPLGANFEVNVPSLDGQPTNLNFVGYSFRLVP
jgi:hypothetical protein